MEESEKRKERLKAMRMEAEVSNDVQASALAGCLSNPLTVTPSTVQDDFGTIPRFDYYTHPMAAFSANNRGGNSRNRTTQQSFAPFRPGPRNFNRDLPLHQMQAHFSHVQGVYNHVPYDPRIRGPSLVHQGQSHASDHYNLVSDGTPRGMFGNSPMHPGTSHSASNPSNMSSYGNLPGPGFNYGTVRPQMFCNSQILDQGPRGSPYFSPGRGRSHGYSGSNTPGLGRSVGRGRGFRGHCSASNRMLGPQSYFDESMLQDPWRHLEPIPWRRQEAETDSSSTPGTSNSWRPNSITTRKAKVSEASSNNFNSQQSLAEYLAASFNKAVEDTQNA